MMERLTLERFTFKTKVGDRDGPDVQIEKLDDTYTQNISAWQKNSKT